MNEQNTPAKVTKEEVEEIMQVVISEAKQQGYQEAARVYIKANGIIWRRGFIAGAIVTAIGMIVGAVLRKKHDEKVKKEALEKEPINVDEAEDVKFEEFEV